MNNKITCANADRLQAAIFQVLNSLRQLAVIDFCTYATLKNKNEANPENAAKAIAQLLNNIVTIDKGA